MFGIEAIIAAAAATCSAAGSNATYDPNKPREIVRYAEPAKEEDFPWVLWAVFLGSLF